MFNRCTELDKSYISLQFVAAKPRPVEKESKAPYPVHRPYHIRTSDDTQEFLATPTTAGQALNHEAVRMVAAAVKVPAGLTAQQPNDRCHRHR